jgi:hypothetical protein
LIGGLSIVPDNNNILAPRGQRLVRAVEYNPSTRKLKLATGRAEFDAQAVVVLPQEELGD